MTEKDWLACTDPMKMLGEVGSTGITCRKARLFCCAYCRCFFWDYLPLGIRAAVEVAEAYADQAASKYKLRKAQDAFLSAGRTTNAEWRANLVAQMAASPSGPFRSACMLLGNRNTLPWKGGKRAIAGLIREIFADPFRPDTLDPAWLTWQEGTIPKLAQALYEEGRLPSGCLDTGRLAVLADALEDAGCVDAEILEHCRGPGPHFRGCWPLDLVLGR